MFKKKPKDDDTPVPEIDPELGLDLDVPVGGEPRTTCYPQDGDPAPGVVGRPRTTVYRQGLKWNRGGYDTVN
jgi:hypothetical protein